MVGLDGSGVADGLWLKSAAITLVNSFIVARIDYCISLLSGCGQLQIDKLQRVMNCAARIIYNCGPQDHVMPLLRDNLHWLCVRERILFTLCLMVYRALSGLAPSYITELCVPVASIRPRSSVRSAAHGTLFVRALVWNSASAHSPSPPQLLGTVSLTTSGTRQHLTNLNSAWKPIFL